MRGSDDPQQQQEQRDDQREAGQLEASPRGFSAYNRSLSTASNASDRAPARSPLRGVDARQYLSAGGPTLGSNGDAGSTAGAQAASVSTGVVHVPLANVDGRVFERLARFRLLPPALKLQSDAAVAYLLAPAVFHTIFDSPSLLHRAICWARNACDGKDFSFSTSGSPRVSGARLLRSLRRYLQVANGMGTQDADAAQQLAQTLVLGGLLSPEREKKRRFTGPVLDAGNDDMDVELLGVLDDHKHLYELVAPGARSLGSSSSAKRAGDRVVSVWDVTDGAMRAGFVFRKPPRKHVLQSGCRGASSASSLGSDEHVLPLNGRVSGARERRVYAVVNGPRRHALVLFRDDVARSQLAYVALRDAIAQYAASPSSPRPASSSRQGGRPPLLYHGLQVWYQPSTECDESRCETLDFLDKRAQERWLRALLDAGATYREVHVDLAAWSAPTASFYALMASKRHHPRGRYQPVSLARADPDDDVLDFATLRGRVVLVVNMPTKEPSKAEAAGVDMGAQLRELVELADRFGPDGLTVLVFPCAQFGDCDDSDDSDDSSDADNDVMDDLSGPTEGTTDDATDSAASTTGNDSAWSQFVEVLAPCDVNGPDAHEVFLFLNARLPGRFGPCVDGDYCKFIVNRRGVPVKRFPPVRAELMTETPETNKCELAHAVHEQLHGRAD